MHYVIDNRNAYVSHQGDEASCREYVYSCISIWGHPKSRYTITNGAKERDSVLKLAKHVIPEM